MDRRRYLEGFGTVVATGALAGCTGGGNGDGTGGDGDDTDGGGGSGDGGTDAYGTLSTSVTDQPNDIGDFESLVVTIDGIWVKPAGPSGDETPDDEGTDTPDDEGTDTPDDEDGDDGGAEGEDDEDEGDTGRRYVEFEEPQEADLVELQDGETQLVDETELEVGEYEFLQLNVSGTTGVLAESGEEATVETPGNAPLKFNQAFEIRAGETTHFLADFAPFRRGNGAYLVRPVASGTEVRYGDDPDGATEDGDGGDDTDASDGDGDAEEPTDDGAAGSDGSDGDGDAGSNATAGSEAAAGGRPAGGN